MSEDDLTLRDLIISLQRSAAAMERSAEAQLLLAQAVAQNSEAVMRLGDECVTLATMLAPDPEEQDPDRRPERYMDGSPVNGSPG